MVRLNRKPVPDACYTRKSAAIEHAQLLLRINGPADVSISEWSETHEFTVDLSKDWTGGKG